MDSCSCSRIAQPCPIPLKTPAAQIKPHIRHRRSNWNGLSPQPSVAVRVPSKAAATDAGQAAAAQQACMPQQAMYSKTHRPCLAVCSSSKKRPYDVPGFQELAEGFSGGHQAYLLPKSYSLHKILAAQQEGQVEHPWQHVQQCQSDKCAVEAADADHHSRVNSNGSSGGSSSGSGSSIRVHAAVGC